MNISIASVNSIPESDEAVISRQRRDGLKVIALLLFADLAISICCLIPECFVTGKNKNYFIISAIVIFIFLLGVAILLLYTEVCVKIAMFSYIIIGGGYYAYRLYCMVSYLIQKDWDIKGALIVGYGLNLVVIVCRIFAFLRMKKYVEIARKIDAHYIIKEHEEFFNKLEHKMNKKKGMGWSIIFNTNSIVDENKNASEDGKNALLDDDEEESDKKDRNLARDLAANFNSDDVKNAKNVSKTYKNADSENILMSDDLED